MSTLLQQTTDLRPSTTICYFNLTLNCLASLCCTFALAFLLYLRVVRRRRIGRCTSGKCPSINNLEHASRNFREARINALPLTRPGVELDGTQTANITTFLQRVGLGFTQIFQDGIANDAPAEYLDVGRIASPTLDLDI